MTTKTVATKKQRRIRYSASLFSFKIQDAQMGCVKQGNILLFQKETLI
jgi:hypothetical protein